MTISLAAMLSPLTVVGAFFFLAASVQGNICNHNDCYRALSGHFGEGKTGSADCSSFLLKTFTPSTTTYSATVIATQTVTITTNTTTIVPATATDDTTIINTATDYVSTTTTYTNIITVTVTTTTVLPTVGGAKRWVEGGPVARQPQQPMSSHGIPSYCDSECDHDPSQFSSACSCLGILPSTTTVAAPSTTVTVTITATATNTGTSVVVDVSTQTVTDTITLSATSFVTVVISSFASTTATATATDVVSQCTNVAALPTYIIPFPYFLNIKNTGIDTGTAASEENCCVSCYETVGCAAYFYYSSLTNHLVCDALIVEDDPLNFNNPPTPMCPLGEQNLNSVDGDNSATLSVKPGPCAS